MGTQVYRGSLFSAPWVVGSHLHLELQVLSHLGRLEIVFLGNVPKEIRSTETAAIPSELGVEQATEHSRVGWGKELRRPPWGRGEGWGQLIPCTFNTILPAGVVFSVHSGANGM